MNSKKYFNAVQVLRQPIYNIQIQFELTKKRLYLTIQPKGLINSITI